MKYKVILQQEEKDCGVACLAMLCHYFGVSNISLAIIKNFAHTDRDGNSIYSLIYAAEKLNMEGDAFEAEYDDFFNGEIQLPAIVHTFVDGSFEHYMVIFECDRNKVKLGDPGKGLITLTWDEFSQIWTNKIIILKPTQNFSENVKYKKNYKSILNLVVKLKKTLFILFVFSALISGISILSSMFYSYLLDTVLPNNDLNLLFKAMLGTIGIFFITVQLNLLKQRFVINLNKKMDQELVLNIYNRITNLPMNFFLNRSTGEIITRFQDTSAIRDIICSYTLDLSLNLIIGMISFVVLLIKNWQVCFITVVMMELTLLVAYLFKSTLQKRSKELVIENSNMMSFVNESFTGTETIKNYNSEKIQQSKMAKKYAKFQQKLYRGQYVQEIQEELMGIITNVGTIFILGVLGLNVIAGNLTVGDLMVCYVLVGYVFNPIVFLIGTFGDLAEVDATLERLDEILKTSTEEELDKKKQHLKGKIEKIKLQNVSFHYGLRDDILKDLSFEVCSGETVGIVGGSGSGKTTLVKLLLAFYFPTSGLLTYNDVDINKYTTTSIRKKVAYVSQNDYWFRDTIINNLTIGNPNATEQEVIKICKMVKMDKYIKKQAYGINSVLEEGGANLSSGERQRFSIAKALLTYPDVLILDESTSNLDAKTEELVVEELA